MSEHSQEDLDALLDLQHTDARIRRLRHLLDDLEEQRALDEVAAETTAVEEQHGEVQLELDRVSSGQRQLEGEVEVLRTRRDAEQARMYGGEIVNPRELQSLRAEITSTERRIADHEDQLLETMEEADRLQTHADGLAARRDELRDRVGERTVARDDAAKGLLAELGELKATRRTQSEGLPAELLERYEHIAGRTGGTGVGKLDGNACTACRIDLSWADVNDLLNGPPLATCPQCQRLLVIPPDPTA